MENLRSVDRSIIKELSHSRLRTKFRNLGMIAKSTGALRPLKSMLVGQVGTSIRSTVMYLSTVDNSSTKVDLKAV